MRKKIVAGMLLRYGSDRTLTSLVLETNKDTTLISVAGTVWVYYPTTLISQWIKDGVYEVICE